MKQKDNRKKEFVFVKTEKDGLLSGRQAPKYMELEQAVLGSVMLERHILNELAADFTEYIFYNESHRIIARAILNLFKENSAIDILTVTQELKKSNELDLVGGAYYITQLTNRVASAANVAFHIKILQQHQLERDMIDSCTKTINRILNNQEDVFDIYDQHQSEIDNALKGVLNHKASSVGKIYARNIQESKEVLAKGVKSGVVTGLTMLDNTTSGWQKSDLIILAGRPGMGKTAAAVSFIMKPALTDNIPVAIFSLEMSGEQLTGRIQSQISGYESSRIIKKQLNKDELDDMHSKCSPILSNAPLYIDDTPNISIIELRAKARTLVMDQGVKLIIVDYLQLMRSGVYSGNREQEIADISRGLKGVAKELQVPVIALSQLSRAVETRGGDKKPGLADLRESGQIEQDADAVLFCYRPEYYEAENYEVEGQTFDAAGLFVLIFAKHRNGELGEIPLEYIARQTKLTNHAFGNNKVESVQQIESTTKSTALTGSEQTFFASTKTVAEEDMPF